MQWLIGSVDLAFALTVIVLDYDANAFSSCFASIIPIVSQAPLRGLTQAVGKRPSLFMMWVRRYVVKLFISQWMGFITLHATGVFITFGGVGVDVRGTAHPKVALCSVTPKQRWAEEAGCLKTTTSLTRQSSMSRASLSWTESHLRGSLCGTYGDGGG